MTRLLGIDLGATNIKGVVLAASHRRSAPNSGTRCSRIVRAVAPSRRAFVGGPWDTGQE